MEEECPSHLSLYLKESCMSLLKSFSLSCYCVSMTLHITNCPVSQQDGLTYKSEQSIFFPPSGCYHPPFSLHELLDCAWLFFRTVPLEYLSFIYFFPQQKILISTFCLWTSGFITLYIYFGRNICQILHARLSDNTCFVTFYTADSTSNI